MKIGNILFGCMIMILSYLNIDAQVIQVTYSNHNEYHPKWSPDGSRIAFTKRSNQDVGIWITPLSGNNQKQVGITKTGDLAFSWSPDGRKIALASLRNGNFDLYVMTVLKN